MHHEVQEAGDLRLEFLGFACRLCGLRHREKPLAVGVGADIADPAKPFKCAPDARLTAPSSSSSGRSREDDEGRRMERFMGHG